MTNRLSPHDYFLLFLGWTVEIVAASALVGAAAFPLVGRMIGAELPASELALSGMKQLGFLGFVWAPGTAIVLCWLRIYRDRKSAAGTGPR